MDQEKISERVPGLGTMSADPAPAQLERMCTVVVIPNFSGRR